MVDIKKTTHETKHIIVEKNYISVEKVEFIGRVRDWERRLHR